MRVNPSALNAQLEKGLVSAYVLFGAEPLMLEEAADQIRTVARQAGVDEVRSMTAGVDLDWLELNANARSLSLFSSRRLIVIRLPTGKPGDAGSKAILTYLDENVEDTILVVIAGRVDKRGQSSKWFKAMEKEGLAIEARALTRDQLPRWIEQRLNSQEIAATAGAVQRLAYYAEGNLMAAAQEISKLALVLGTGATLDEKRLDELTQDQARFSVYNLVDTALSGDEIRALRILSVLRREGTESVLLVWALAREVRTLEAVSAALASGESQADIFRRHQVWRSRVNCVNAALRRHPHGYWAALLSRLCQLDYVVKGRKSAAGSVWAELEQVLLSVCGINTVSTSVT